MRRYAIALAILALTLTAAEARPYARAHSSDVGQILPHPSGCPSRLFCGCGVSVRVFGHAIKALFNHRAWLHFPRTYAHAGAVAVWRGSPGHVAYIESVSGDGAVLYDPNSGHHLTRRHLASLQGATIVDPHGNLALSARTLSHRPQSPRSASLRYSPPTDDWGRRRVGGADFGA